MLEIDGIKFDHYETDWDFGWQTIPIVEIQIMEKDEITPYMTFNEYVENTETIM